MPKYHYEVIYETGEHSVISGDSDEEALAGVKEQHRRAVNGEPGGPGGQVAVRVKKVLKYNEHPGSRYESKTVPVKELKSWLDSAVEQNQIGDLISVPEVISSLRNDLDALVEGGPHDSNYKMKEADELDPKLWEVAA